MQEINYHNEYKNSKLHLYVLGGTIGLGLIIASWFSLIVGCTIYGLSWLFLPDMKFFKDEVDEKYKGIEDEKNKLVLSEFNEKRNKMVKALSSDRTRRYYDLSMICKEIERSTLDTVSSQDAASDIRLKKIDELMFTDLKLLGIEQSLETFIAYTEKEDLPSEIEGAIKNVSRVKSEIEKIKDDPTKGNTLEAKNRLLASFSDKVNVLQKRVDRFEQAKTNIQLVTAEQERLSAQIKLLRDEAVASRNADAISERIDASMQHLDETNKLLSELTEFKDYAGELPPSSGRVGFEVATPEIEDSPAPRRRGQVTTYNNYN